MSDATAKARRLNNMPIRFQPPRDVINAMLDVIDAAESAAGTFPDSDQGAEAHMELFRALVRFGEVSGE